MNFRIIILFCKTYKIKEIFLVIESNIFEFKDIKSIEMHNNILLNELSNKKKLFIKAFNIWYNKKI